MHGETKTDDHKKYVCTAGKKRVDTHGRHDGTLHCEHQPHRDAGNELATVRDREGNRRAKTQGGQQTDFRHTAASHGRRG